MIVFQRIACLAFALAGLAHGQLAATLRLNKKQYLAGEAVIAVVGITNHAGQDITFFSDGRTQWLDFMLKDNRGEPVSPRGSSVFGKMTLKAGQTVARQVNLSEHFILSEPGGYSALAVIHMPESIGQSSTTNRVLFNQSPGAVYWKQKVGVSGKPGKTREFRVINFNGDSASQIYAQVIDDRTGQNIHTFLLGDVLMLRKPLVAVDRNQQMHVMYLGTPSMWVHCQVDTDGKLINREVHQRAGQGDPQLLTFPDGTVRVSNSVLYDPKADAAAKSKVRKASDRPVGM